MAKAKVEVPTLEDMVNALSSGLHKAAVRPNINGYTPHRKQEIFHRSLVKGKLYIGGNRAGKTTGGACEAIWRCKGEHPFKRVAEPPVYGRVVGVDFKQGIDKIVLPEISRWIPPSLLVNGSWMDSYQGGDVRVLTLENGSKIDFMSNDQDLEKHAGVSRNFCWFDEEPSHAIFNENKARLIDTGGDWWITMTPVEGMTWTYDNIYIPGTVPTEDERNDPEILVVEVDMTENPYLSEAEIDSFTSGLDADERDARVHGKFIQIGGLVFKKFSPQIHVIEPMMPDLNWKHYASLDHGYNNPTAWLYHAVSPNGYVITYDELYERERLVAYFARRLIERNKTPGRRAPDLYVGDPAIKQRQGVTGDSIHMAYAQLGIGIELGINDVAIGVNKMNQYLYHDEEIKAHWYITRNCVNLIRELLKLRWKTYESKKLDEKNNRREEIHKKDDHACDSSRYFFTLLPDLRPSIQQRVSNANKNVAEFLRPATPVKVDGRIDEYLKATNQMGKQPEAEWTVIDEHMGGIW
jgi:phage terminase large subunit-like protein